MRSPGPACRDSTTTARSSAAALEPDIESLESSGDHGRRPSQIHSILVGIMRMRHHGAGQALWTMSWSRRSGDAKLLRTGCSSPHAASGRQADKMTRRDYRRNIPRRYYSVLRTQQLFSQAGSLLCNTVLAHPAARCTPFRAGDQEMTGHPAAKASRAGGFGCMPCSRRLAPLLAVAYLLRSE